MLSPFAAFDNESVLPMARYCSIRCVLSRNHSRDANESASKRTSIRHWSPEKNGSTGNFGSAAEKRPRCGQLKSRRFLGSATRILSDPEGQNAPIERFFRRFPPPQVPASNQATRALRSAFSDNRIVTKFPDEPHFGAVVANWGRTRIGL